MPFLGTTGGGSVKQYGGQANLGYFIKNSLRLRRANSAYLSRTFGTPTSNILWTWSCWFKIGQFGTGRRFFGRGTDASGVNQTAFTLNTDDTINFFIGDGAGGTLAYLATSQVFRDPAAWYHIVFVYDSANGTANNRMRMYLNGTEITAFSSRTNPGSSQSSQWNVASVEHRIGVLPTSSSNYFDGYMAEINFIDGQALTPSSFGKTDNGTGQWIPKKYLSTYGNNGFYLKFADASAATAAAIGKDSSSNGNNWTPNNISVTAGATYDSMTDVPTLTSATAANYATWNVLNQATGPFTVANGNLQYTATAVNATCAMTIYPQTGKWYSESVFTVGASNYYSAIGVVRAGTTAQWYASGVYYTSHAYKFVDGTLTAGFGATWAVGDVMGMALDLDGGTIYFYKNNSLQGTITLPSSTTGWTFSFGDSNASGGTTGSINVGQQPFTYTPPTGFKSLNTYNLP